MRTKKFIAVFSRAMPFELSPDRADDATIRRIVKQIIQQHSIEYDQVTVCKVNYPSDNEPDDDWADKLDFNL